MAYATSTGLPVCLSLTSSLTHGKGVIGRLSLSPKPGVSIEYLKTIFMEQVARSCNN